MQVVGDLATLKAIPDYFKKKGLLCSLYYRYIKQTWGNKQTDFFHLLHEKQVQGEAKASK